MSTPSETAVRVNQGHYSHYSREALESTLDAASNHPSESVNRRYIVPLQVAYASAMAERDRLAAQKAQLLAALIAVSARFERVSAAAYPAHQPESITVLLQQARAAISATKPSPLAYEAPPAPALTALDERVMRVLDCATFFYSKRNADGSRVDFWQLVKAVHPYPAGTVMTLAKLHEILFP